MRRLRNMLRGDTGNEPAEAHRLPIAHASITGLTCARKKEFVRLIRIVESKWPPANLQMLREHD